MNGHQSFEERIFGDSWFEAMMYFDSDLLEGDWQGTKYYLVFGFF